MKTLSTLAQEYEKLGVGHLAKSTRSNYIYRMKALVARLGEDAAPVSGIFRAKYSPVNVNLFVNPPDPCRAYYKASFSCRNLCTPYTSHQESRTLLCPPSPRISALAASL
jgi:hypothetical protein